MEEIMEIMTKVCTDCGIKKDLLEFNKDHWGRFGVRAWCKSCSRKRSIEYHKKHRKSKRPYKSVVKRIAKIGFKFCGKCNIEKSLDEFSTDSRSKSGYKSWCKDCNAKYRRDKYLTNEKFRDECLQKRREKYRIDDKFKNKVKEMAKERHQRLYLPGSEYRERVLKLGRIHELRVNFGMTEDDYTKRLESQNFGCMICTTKSPGKRIKHFNIDHDHKTGNVRGLLCSGCNHGLGFFKDDISLLERAIQYLKGELK